jgi:hypothetical protein
MRIAGSDVCQPKPDQCFLTGCSADFARHKPGMVPEALAIVVRNGGVLDVDETAGTSQVFNLSLPQPRIFSEGFDCLTDPRYKDANVNCGLTFTGTLPLIVQAVRGAVTDQRGIVLSSSNRTRVGQYYTIWLTGLGPFTNGKPTSSVSMGLNREVSQPQIPIGDWDSQFCEGAPIGEGLVNRDFEPVLAAAGDRSLVPISSDLCRIWQDFQRAAAAESCGIT